MLKSLTTGSSRIFHSGLGHQLSKATMNGTRSLAQAATAPKKEGDISSVFASLSGQETKPLDPRFIDMKKQLLAGHENTVVESFHRLLRQIKGEVEEIKDLGSNVIPTIDFSDLSAPTPAFAAAHKKHGVAVIRNVIPESEALDMLQNTKNYIAANPQTKGFPKDSPSVYELYWSPAQVQARAHPNLLKAQSFLMSHWSNTSPNALLSTSHPVAYADRLRIRPPGDAKFTLGPHVDSGSCERWEPEGYGRGGVYTPIFAGNWESYDPFDASARFAVVSDLYNAAGGCSAFRMYQGWLSLSNTGPGEGTLKVNPLFSRATSYFLLRPFFAPENPSPESPGFLDPENWTLEPETTSALQGAYPGQIQEFTPALHPHLELEKTMVSMPRVRPGDYVAWHCDSMHGVDSTHNGTDFSSVMYIPSCPLTEETAQYLVTQRDAFLKGVPSPDFPGGVGESEHVSRPTKDIFEKYSVEGTRAMGLERWAVEQSSDDKERKLLTRANEILGYA